MQQTHIQAQNRPTLNANSPVLTLQEATQKIVNKRGVGGLFRGLNAMVAGAGTILFHYQYYYEREDH